jgi:hypothetical protein
MGGATLINEQMWRLYEVKKLELEVIRKGSLLCECVCGVDDRSQVNRGILLLLTWPLEEILVRCFVLTQPNDRSA